MIFASGLAANDPLWLWFMAVVGVVWLLCILFGLGDNDVIADQQAAARLRAAWKANDPTVKFVTKNLPAPVAYLVLKAKGY